jgi:anti-sigma factor (TIGR02949 family)
MGMDCHSVREKVFAFLDGEAPEEDIRDLEAHFHHCFPCYQRMTLQRALGKLVRARTRGRDLPTGMEGRLRGEIQKRARSDGRAPLLDRPIVWLVAAAAVFLAVGLTAAFSGADGRGTAGGPSVAGLVARPVALEGRVVCLGCECGKASGRSCLHTHEFGLRTAEGRLLKVLETKVAWPIRHEPRNAGRIVQVRGMIYEPHGILEVEGLDWR